ncbi:MAG: hypothetical protein V3T23_13800 [Nitrososphaerales archaeon]
MTQQVFGDIDTNEVIHVDREIQVVVFAPSTPCVTGDGKVHIPIPSTVDGFDLETAHAQVVTVGGSGTMDIQIHNVTDGVDMLSTKLTIDAGEKGSNTAATPVVVDTNNDDVVEFDEIRIDIDAIHTAPAAKGLVVRLTFTKP